MVDARTSIKSWDWGTPNDLTGAVRSFTGRIDLDPASSLEHNARVGALQIITKEENALANDWPVAETIFCNPPGQRVPRGELHYPARWFARMWRRIKAERARYGWFWAYNIDTMRHLQTWWRLHEPEWPWPFCVWMPPNRVKHVGAGSSPVGYSAMVCMALQPFDSWCMVIHLEEQCGGIALNPVRKGESYGG